MIKDIFINAIVDTSNKVKKMQISDEKKKEYIKLLENMMEDYSYCVFYYNGKEGLTSIRNTFFARLFKTETELGISDDVSIISLLDDEDEAKRILK